MSYSLSRPSRLFIYIGAVTCAILLFRFWKVNTNPGAQQFPFNPFVPVAAGINLRILPLGDSITVGDKSTAGHGYRFELNRYLTGAGGERKMSFIGTKNSGGDFANNLHEGWSGLRISEILDKVLTSGALRYHPNVVLLQAGTNDLKEADPPVPENTDQAPHRLGVLIDAIQCENPTAAIYVAKLTGQRPLPAQARVDQFNAQLHELVAVKLAEGTNIKLVDQSGVIALELADDLHPNDAGYTHMAQNWYQAMQLTPESWFEDIKGEIKTDLQPKVCKQEDSHWKELMAKPPPGA